MKTMTRASIKLLTRTRSFWFFLLLTPLLSSFILGMKQNNLSYYESSVVGEITELDRPEMKVAYYGGKGRCVVKVYDACKSDASEYMLKKISDSGLFQVCRADITDSDPENADRLLEKWIRNDGASDRMGAALYIGPDFDRYVTGNRTDAPVSLYILSKDSRVDALQTEIDGIFRRFKAARSTASDVTPKGIREALEASDELLFEKKIVNVSAAEKQVLTTDQINQKTRLGYAMAILTIGYVFCGLFVAHIAINEQKDSVLTRIKLTGTNMTAYFLSKVVTVVFVTFILTLILSLFCLSLDVESMGIDRLELFTIMFLMGLVFGTLSLMLGILIGDVMSSNIAAFTLWSMSSMLSGLYFPLDHTSDALKGISKVLPHTWFMDGAEMILRGDKTWLFMVLCVTVAYLILIGSIGSLGLRISKVEEWGNT